MIGTGDGQQYEDQFSHALATTKSEHPPEWIGNKMYGDAFDLVDKNPNSSYKIPSDPHEEDMDKFSPPRKESPEINPQYVPSSMTGPSWNKVASIDSTMPLRAPIEPTSELKSSLGTQVADKSSNIQNGIDRSHFQEELAKNPGLIPKMASMVKGEVGLGKTPLESQQIQLETAFNRAHARGHSLSQALLSVSEDPRKGYYAGGPHGTYGRPATPAEIEAFKTNVLGPVMAGSNLSDRGQGPMTGNASAGVAKHQFARGTIGYTDKATGESYFNEETGKHLANLKNFPRVQGADPNKVNPDLSPQSVQVAMNDKFIPFNPMQPNPQGTNPGGHGHIEPIANPGRAVPVHKETPEAIYSAAIKTDRGEIHIGINHADAYLSALEAKGMKPSDHLSDEAQGFVTNKGRFVSRHEAADIADKQKQRSNDYASPHGLLSEELDPSRVEDVRGALRYFFQNSEPPKKDKKKK